MTRLVEQDICGIGETMAEYDRRLRDKTGAGLSRVACLAAGLDETRFHGTAAGLTLAAVTVTSGQGAIGGFAETVADIVRHLGLKAFVPTKNDIAGLAEAFERGADIVSVADDDRFVFLNPVRRTVVDNADATGRGFAAALELMANGIEGRDVLVLGAGPVGRSAAAFLAGRGARVGLYDIVKETALDASRALQGAAGGHIRVEEDLGAALKGRRHIIDATPAAGFLTEDSLEAEVLISAPGVPLGLSTTAFEKLGHRVVHDPLQIGVAAMTAMAVRDIIGG